MVAISSGTVVIINPLTDKWTVSGGQFLVDDRNGRWICTHDAHSDGKGFGNCLPYPGNPATEILWTLTDGGIEPFVFDASAADVSAPNDGAFDAASEIAPSADAAGG